MKIIADTHAHTIVSGHAYSTIREMAAAGKRNGLSLLALTEHAPMMPGSTHRFYFENLKVVPRQMEGIRLLLGAEVNIMDPEGNVDLPDELLGRLDIVVASIHTPCYGTGRTKEENTRAYRRVMENPHIHIIGHPDDSRFPVDYEELVKGAKETGTLLEVNNSSMQANSFREGAWENLRTMLDACRQHGVPVTTGSDAHVDVDAGNFANSLQLFKATGFPKELIATTSVEKLLSHLKK